MGLGLNATCIRSASGTGPFAPLTLHIPAGSVDTALGRSNVGKSTLLDGIGRHLAHGFRLTGTVTLNGRDVTTLPAESRRIGVMFQDALLYPHLSVGWIWSDHRQVPRHAQLTHEPATRLAHRQMKKDLKGLPWAQLFVDQYAGTGCDFFAA